MAIVSIYNDSQRVLSTKTDAFEINPEGLAEAAKVADQLRVDLLPKMPAAGLAAPQIGVSKQIFIYSWDRSIESLEVAINPTYEPLSGDTYISWEACFSTIPEKGPYKISNTPRYTKIRATYFNLKGEKVNLTLDGFAAKVFQHEYDHLQGIVCLKAKGSEIKEFETFEGMIAFMTRVKSEDGARYVKPTQIAAVS